MDVRYTGDPIRFSHMPTQEIRENYLVDSLFKVSSIKMLYCDVDRVIIGSATPVKEPLTLDSSPELRANSFCERRELGVLNIGGPGTIMVDGQRFSMQPEDALYIGRGSQSIKFASLSVEKPARYYLLSYPAHKEYPTAHIQQSEAETAELGSIEESNKRVIYKLIHPDGVKSCQLVMGYTRLAPGCVWNTMPPHTHERRMEVYLYYDMKEDTRVFHFMGRPEETRHIVVANNQAVVSPSWSLHCGVGTSSYTFCWGMGGENQAFGDMDHLTAAQLK